MKVRSIAGEEYKIVAGVVMVDSGETVWAEDQILKGLEGICMHNIPTRELAVAVLVCQWCEHMGMLRDLGNIVRDKTDQSKK